jgi:hypothetical protein
LDIGDFLSQAFSSRILTVAGAKGFLAETVLFNPLEVLALEGLLPFPPALVERAFLATAQILSVCCEVELPVAHHDSLTHLPAGRPT